MRWTLKPKPPVEKVAALSQALGVPSIVATLLIQRGIETFEQAKTFFRPTLDQLHDPFLMKDMERAVARVEQALQKGEKILIYGDYDVDGTTSVALLYAYLKTRHEKLGTYIPDRYAEGYGISTQGIDFAAAEGYSLIIALDCGIKAVDKVAYAQEKKIDFIICDHHRPGDQVPEAVAVLDPKQADCDYPYKELCGCGVGFKLVEALATRQGQTREDLLPYLDLVATAIGADIVPITGENRVLTFLGLQAINSNPRPGIKALSRQTKKDQLNVSDVVFIIAPRINAAGRMKHGLHAVELLVETDWEQAENFAREIEQYNADRKDADREITEQALLQIQENSEENRMTTVVYDEHWHKGVIGIVASRLTETYYRPTVVFTKSGQKLAASVRSVRHFDVYNALEACADCMEQFGGHMYAAGLTLLPEHYNAFKAKFEQVVQETIDPKLLTPELLADTEISPDDITPKLFRILRQFAPFGPGNMTPVFVSQNLEDTTGWSKPVGQDNQHLRLVLKQKNGQILSGIGFGLGEKYALINNGKSFSAAYSLEENIWNGQASIQLRLRDLRQGKVF